MADQTQMDPARLAASQPVANVTDWRRIISGFTLVMLAAIVLFLRDAPWDSVSTFRISRPRDTWAVGNLVVPSQLINTLAAIILAFLGTRLFLRGGGRWTGLSLGVGLIILAMAFLVWATAGKAISLTGSGGWTRGFPVPTLWRTR